MRAILMSDRPKRVVKIINGKKFLEIRSKFPKNYVGWVYIYCTKQEPIFYDTKIKKCINLFELTGVKCNGKSIYSTNLTRYNIKYFNEILNGHVVARFRCDEVIDVFYTPYFTYETEGLFEIDVLNYSCLTESEIRHYLKYKNGFAIPISKLEIFDKPKEISEFYKSFRRKYYKNPFAQDIHKEKNALVQPTKYGYEYTYPLTKAPQSWCYIEVEE